MALYDGPTQERSEIAVIRRSSGGDLRVFRIDAQYTRGYEWHVEPGPHRVWAELVQYGTALNVRFKGWTYCSIDFEASAGGDYQVVSENDQQHYASGTEVSLGTRIVDAAGETVGWPECSGRRPRFDD